MHKISLPLLLIAAGVIVAAGCSKSTTPEEVVNASTSIVGTVTDSAGYAIPNAEVFVQYFLYTPMPGRASAKSCSLLYFRLTPQFNGVALSWKDTLETDAYFWMIERAHRSDSLAFAQIASLPAGGTAPSGFNYAYLDSSGTSGSVLYYRLSMMDLSGHRTWFDPAIACCRKVVTSAAGSYEITNVPVDTAVAIINANGVTTATQTIGRTYGFQVRKAGHAYHVGTITVNKNVRNTANVTLH